MYKFTSQALSSIEKYIFDVKVQNISEFGCKNIMQTFSVHAVTPSFIVSRALGNSLMATQITAFIVWFPVCGQSFSCSNCSNCWKY